MKKPVLIIGGPTASGKSGLALAVAEALNGTVINADSMQIYQGLPILTAQPSQADCAKVPHKLYATLPPTEVCSAARWRDLALAEIRTAQKENKLPVITGGTGFYLRTLLLGISPIPDIPASFRAEAAALQKELGNPRFHEELAKRDPLTAAKLDPFNTQRLVRAWEVFHATGKSLAAWQSAPRTGTPEDLRFLTVTLQPPRDLLYAACNGRFHSHTEDGRSGGSKKIQRTISRRHAPVQGARLPRTAGASRRKNHSRRTPSRWRNNPPAITLSGKRHPGSVTRYRLIW